MMQVEVNGTRRELEPASIDELRGYLNGAVPPGEVICVLRVNGQDVSEQSLQTFPVSSIRTLEVRSAPPAALARDALPEAIDWTRRLSGVARSIAEDYRAGDERRAVDRLPPVADALQVLVGLISGIREFGLDPATETALAAPWDEAIEDLRAVLDAFVSEYTSGDSIRLADLLGHELPNVLERFAQLLESVKR